MYVPGYSVIRKDRVGRQRGGVCLFLRDDLTGEVLSSYSNGVCEFLIVQVHQLNTIVTVVYRPPDTDISEFNPILKKIDKVLQNLPPPTPTIPVMGDLNFPSSVITCRLLRCAPTQGGRVQSTEGGRAKMKWVPKSDNRLRTCVTTSSSK